MAYFIATYIFMAIFFYYMLTFLVATACALWFYSKEGNFFTIGTCHLTKYHIGSLTFAALVVAPIKLLKVLLGLKQRYSENACMRCFQCCLGCLLDWV